MIMIKETFSKNCASAFVYVSCNSQPTYLNFGEIVSSSLMKEDMSCT